MRLLGLPDQHQYNFSTLTAKNSEIYNWAGSRMNFHQVSPAREWGDQRHKFFAVYDDADAIIMKLQYPELVEHRWTEVIAPDDDQEVKVICRRCNGYVFSVSGFEWKYENGYRVYNCTTKQDGSCQYE